MHERRTRTLNSAPTVRGRYVLYWMQASQRAADNPALDVAIERANALALPVLCVFGLTSSYPEANLRHYTFMLQGLVETRASLEDIGIQLAVIKGSPDAAALSLAPEAALVVCDRGYLRHQRKWRQTVAAGARCSVVEVEGDVVVPIDEASSQREWSAATLRPKILRMAEDCLRGGRSPRPRKDSRGMSVPGSIRSLSPDTLASLSLDGSVAPVMAPGAAQGGTRHALARLRKFVSEKLPWYSDERQDPTLEAHSGLSSYLHFGQVSPVRIARVAAAARHASEGARAAFLEQLIVRRELAMNFVEHTHDYDRFSCLPAWARATLAAHARDPRPHRYSPAELEAAATHDRYWNAAMKEMKLTGALHGHMRMYWGKKILEWSANPASAYRAALHLNNRWFLDGRDPCSYAGVAWCFGLHDRPWGQRPVFGTVRFMNEAGMRRKFDMEGYIRAVEEREAAAPAAEKKTSRDPRGGPRLNERRS